MAGKQVLKQLLLILLLCAQASSQPQSRERQRQGWNAQEDRHDIVPHTVRCGEDGDDVCPTRTTCCGDGACMPTSTLHGGSVCCRQDDDAPPTGGCPPGYACAPEKKCRLDEGSPAWRERGNPMPRLDDVGRVAPCRLPPGSAEAAHVLPIRSSADASSPAGEAAGGDRQKPFLFPYFSTRGNLSAFEGAIPEIRLAVVAVHGSRNLYEADAYLCLAQAASTLQTLYDNDSIVFVAPLFMGVKGEHVTEDATALWRRSGLSEEDERHIPQWEGFGPWVLGESGHAQDGKRGLGSYEVLDAFVDLFSNRDAFPNLEGIVVVGNDIAQRWALLSSHPAGKGGKGRPHVRAVAISPSRYAYPTPLRYGGGDWRTPEDWVKSGAAPQCNNIDRWPYGLGGYDEVNPALPYGDRILDALGVSDAKQAPELILDRYARRDVIYLIGELETSPLSSEAALRSPFQCADAYQGTHRYDRAARYFRALSEAVDDRGDGTELSHRMMVAERVGHEMSMVYQTPCGVEALFGGWSGKERKASPLCHPVSQDVMYKSCVVPKPDSDSSSGMHQDLYKFLLARERDTQNQHVPGIVEENRISHK